MKLKIDIEFIDNSDEMDIKVIIEALEKYCSDFVLSGDNGSHLTSMGWNASN